MVASLENWSETSMHPQYKFKWEQGKLTHYHGVPMQDEGGSLTLALCPVLDRHKKIGVSKK